jgi:hypothetical protein
VNRSPERWRRCSTCKRDIGFGAVYWTCSVSTCNRARSALQFCSVSCWDSHVPILRHRDAWAVEERSPGREPPPRAGPRAPPAAARPAAPAPARSAAPTTPLKPAGKEMEKREKPGSAEREILIVASKLKSYIRERSGFNTSDRCLEVLSDCVRALCDRAIESARRDERKTVLERDFTQR